ncbi:MAG: DEAD/DEAH box helicase, partial [Treponema sp.]|nr:DEAD/DEAH box helicase [Candidatus Treponema equi]
MENSLLKSLLPLLSSCENLHQCVVDCADSQAESFPVQVSGLKGSLNSFFIAQFIQRCGLNEIHSMQYENHHSQWQKDYIMVVATQKDADECESDLQTVLGDGIEIYKLPWWGTIPYRPVSVGAAVFGERAGVLAKMAQRNPAKGKPRIFILSQRALISPVPPVDYIRGLSIVLRKGQEADIEQIASKLAEYGYLRVPKVNQRGEFALRGEVLDVFISGEDMPVRIQFDFDTILQIRTFDVESQNTKDKIERLVVYPMKEVVWTDELVDHLEKVLDQEDSEGIRNDFAAYDKARRTGQVQEEENNRAQEVQSINSPDFKAENIHLALTDKAKKEKERLLTELSVQKESEGEELFYGLIWEKQNCVLEYFAPDTPVFFFDWDRLINAKKMLDNEYSVSYRTARQNFPVFLPKEMQIDFYELVHEINCLYAFRTLDTLSNDGEEQSLEGFRFNFNSSYSVACESSQSYFGNIKYFKEQLAHYQEEKWHVFIFADNANQALRVNELVKEFVEVEDNTIFPVTVFPYAITSGFSIGDENILVIQENEIFGRKRNAPKSTRKVRSEALDSFVDLTPGDYVVHVQYGIGRFIKIERHKTNGTEKDYIKIEYADEDIVYIPIEQVNMVQRYIGNENEHPRLDKIGSKSWSARKARVQKQVEEMAERLIDLYSKRQASRGFPFPKDGEWSVAFEAAFPYEDTPDQWTATQDIKADMESSVPMDRLVCGDVGYGKTEIAMRAAFKAVMGGKQVAFLAPTTILAEQHYENCLERFKNFPVTIAHMSRFVTPTEQKKILKKLEEHQVDILIGTHRIIQKDVKYADLGLMIIDEEQRFGVKDKEKLKELKTNIDSLALSATPIPRTLHM